MSKNILFIDDTILKERTTIHGNIDPKMLYPEIKVVQDMQMERLLGTALYTKLQNDIDGGTLTGQYETLLTDYLIDCLIWYVCAEIPMTLSMQFFNKGVVRSSGQDTELPSLTELVTLQDKYRGRGEHYAERTKRYLIEESSKGNFPEYINPGSRADTVFPYGGTFSLPVNLESDYYCERKRRGDYGSREYISDCNI